MHTSDELKILLMHDPDIARFVTEYHEFTKNWNTYIGITVTDGSILEYLNNDGFPVVYADFDGFILVKFG